MAVPVRRWVLEVGSAYPIVGLVALRLRLPSKILASQDPVHSLGNYDEPKNSMIFLEIVDTVLDCLADQPQKYPSRPAYQLRADLEIILREGGSAYEITPDNRGLQRRVERTVREAFERSVESDNSINRQAADHLSKSFAAAYGLKPVPGIAYSEAIKAVEAIANPYFLPNDKEPTLGKVRSHLDQSRSKYEMVISDRVGGSAGIDAMVELVSLLWHGQRDRHSGGPTTTPITQESAETAVHAAAVLVQWVASGSIRKK